MDSKVRAAVLKAAVQAAQAAAASPSIAIEGSAVGPVAERVTREVGPIIEHLTNSEPWYASRVTWGAILSAVGATGALVGFPIAEELQNEILEVISLWTTVGGLVSGPLLTVYGRWRAKRPIGATQKAA